MRKILFISLLILTTPSVFSQKNPGQYTILFYNLENLFDTIDDPGKKDEDFLPGATVAWNTARYFKKLNDLARVIISSDSVGFPAVVGVAEAENRKVLQDLVTKTSLNKKKYEIILEEGPDPRGIDVGLLYRKDLFKVTGYRAYRGAETFDGRFILYVKLATQRDTLNVFVNHWKSRSGGQQETAPMRMESAVILKHITDSLLAQNPRANLIIMGDLNDEPTDASIRDGLKALHPSKNVNNAALYNLMAGPLSKGEGTIYYKDWDIFDQIIVSGNLINLSTPGIKTSSDGKILKRSWMLYKNRQGEMIPSRTAGSKEYFGGVSDHLPVYILLKNQ